MSSTRANAESFKISDYIKMLNCYFVRDDVLSNSKIPPFQNHFYTSENLHQHNTRHAKQTSVILTQWNTDFYDNTIPVSISMEQTSKRNKTPIIFCKNSDLKQKN